MALMKSYEARLLLLQMTQRNYGVPTSDAFGQVVPEPEDVVAFVLAQKAGFPEPASENS